MKAQAFFARADLAEQRACLIANAMCRRATLRTMFRIVSRLGDGVFWYVLIACMPLIVGPGDVSSGASASLHMLLGGAVGLVIYKALKRKLVRERPFIGLMGVECAIPPLDRYSFPSGHTLHAVLFSTIAISYAPALVFVLAPFAALVAMSRIVLGLHYPSDVLAGALIGYAIAKLSAAVASVGL